MKISREIKTGIFAIVIIALSFWGFNFLKGQNLFNGVLNTYFVSYNNVQGLSTASEVTINGLNVGKVVDIKFDNSPNNKGKLIVEFSVDTDFDFSKKSIAKLYSPSPLGGMSLALVPSYEGDKAVPGDFLNGEIEAGILSSITDKLNPLQNKIEGVIVKADSLMLGLNQVLNADTRKNLKNSIAQLNTITYNFGKASKSLNSLLEDNKSKLDQTFTNAEKMTTDFSKFSKSMSEIDLKNTVSKLEGTLSNFNSIITSMKDGNGTVGKLLYDEAMYNNLTNASKEMEELLREMKEHPKRFVHFSLFGKKDKGFKESEEEQKK